MKIEYGTAEEEKVIDSEGSTRTDVWHYRGGVPVLAKRYKIRHKVTNKTEELAIIVNARKEHPNDVSFIIENPKQKKDNAYYVIVCWEE